MFFDLYFVLHYITYFKMECFVLQNTLIHFVSKNQDVYVLSNKTVFSTIIYS